MIIMSDKELPQMYNNNLDEKDEQNVSHPPNTELTETIGVETMKDGKIEHHATHHPKPEKTETTIFQTMSNEKDKQHTTNPFKTELTETVAFQALKDGQEQTKEQDETQPHKIEMEETTCPKTTKERIDEQNNTHPPNLEKQETIGLEATKDGEDYQTATHPAVRSISESVGIQTRMDGMEETNAIHHPNINLTEIIGLETNEDGEEGQNATHLSNTERTETVEFQIMMDGVQCSMPDNENSNTVNNKPHDDCKKMKRTHVNLKNKNKKLRKSVIDMDRTLSREKNIVSQLQEREKHLVSEIEKANALNKQLHSDCEMLQSANTLLVKENKILQTSVHDKDISLSCEMKTVSDLEKRENYLLLELEKANAMNNQLHSDCVALQSTNNKLLKENTVFQKLIHDNDQSLSNERKTVSDLRKRVESLVLELERTNAVNNQLHSDIEILKNMHYNIERKNEQLEKSLNDMDIALFKEKETVSNLQKRLEIMQNQAQNYHQTEARLKEAYDNEVLKSEIQRKQICDLQVQRHDSLNRLSKLAGDILTHENTNIADLSDENRPTKLSEVYSELYDNEWTDAFEELTGRDLTDTLAVGKLLDMLLLSFRKCREVTWERYQSLKSTMSTIDIVHILHSMKEVTEIEENFKTTCTESELSSHNEKCSNISSHSQPQNKESEAKELVETSEPMELIHPREYHGEHGTEMIIYTDNCATNGCRETEVLCNRNKKGEFTKRTNEKHLTCTTTLTVDQEREIKRIWRTSTFALMDEAVRHLHIVLLAKFDISTEHWPNTSKYLARCIELCWKMGVQEKPMHLDAFDENDDGGEKIFNQAKFRAYTKTGKRVAFVVWPALFIHEGGAMLVKAIAQGCQ